MLLYAPRRLLLQLKLVSSAQRRPPAGSTVHVACASRRRRQCSCHRQATRHLAQVLCGTRARARPPHHRWLLPTGRLLQHGAAAPRVAPLCPWPPTSQQRPCTASRPTSSARAAAMIQRVLSPPLATSRKPTPACCHVAACTCGCLVRVLVSQHVGSASIGEAASARAANTTTTGRWRCVERQDVFGGTSCYAQRLEQKKRAQPLGVSYPPLWNPAP